MQPEKVTKPKREKTPEEALSTLMRLCARAERSQGDARRLLRGWGIREAEAERIVERLVRERFIDDTRYAEAFVREKLRLSGWGAYKIRTALQRKGIRRELIDAALAQAEGADMGERLAQMLARKARTMRAATPYELGENESHLCLRVAGDYDAVREYHRAMGCVCFENHDMGLYFIHDPDDYWIEVLPVKE